MAYIWSLKRRTTHSQGRRFTQTFITAKYMLLIQRMMQEQGTVSELPDSFAKDLLQILSGGGSFKTGCSEFS